MTDTPDALLPLDDDAWDSATDALDKALIDNRSGGRDLSSEQVSEEVIRAYLEKLRPLPPNALELAHEAESMARFYQERPAVDAEKRSPQMMEISVRECRDISLLLMNLACALLAGRPQESADLSAAQDLAMHVSFDPTWLAHNGDHIKRLVGAVLRLSAEGGERG